MSDFGFKDDRGAPCPCRSGHSYSECCGEIHEGKPAPTPEALMRSRYSAFALNLNPYLLSSWHSSTRPNSLEPNTDSHWKNLQIVGSGIDGHRGWVHFRATFVEAGRWACLEERSNFQMEEGHWRYVDGNPQLNALQPERNGPCPCGSGQKFKKCCLG